VAATTNNKPEVT